MIKLRLFRFFLMLLCRIFRYKGVLYNVKWHVQFGDLINDKNIDALNNVIVDKTSARLRTVTKDDMKKGGHNGFLP